MEDKSITTRYPQGIYESMSRIAEQHRRSFNAEVLIALEHYIDKEEKSMLHLGKSSWVGAEGAAFERVRLAFQSAGYEPPRPDTEGGSGAFVMNIVGQYIAALSERQSMAIIRYGMKNKRNYLLQQVERPELRPSVEDITRSYGADE